MIVPKYMLNFKCVGGSCEDNCCIGWDVDIDKKTYLKYQKVQEPRMKNEFKKYIHINTNCYDPVVDYAYAALDDSRRCQFLNSENLCMIHKYMGESYLSNVCTNFPRITNKIDGKLEQSATPSCPEIARKIVSDPDAMQLVEIDEENINELLTYKIKQNDKLYKNTLIANLKLVRDQAMKILSSECYSVEISLVILSNFIEDCFMLEKNKTLNLLEEVIEKYDRYMNSNKTRSDFFISKKYNLFDDASFISYTDYLLKHLSGIGASDSARFLEITQIASTGNINIGTQNYKTFLNQSSYILKNYFVNHVFRTLFPFSEGENIREALWLLLIRYGIIKRHLIGLMGQEKSLSEQEIAEYLQVVSKVIEHHKHFEYSMIEQMRREKSQTKKLIELLLETMVDS